MRTTFQKVKNMPLRWKKNAFNDFFFKVGKTAISLTRFISQRKSVKQVDWFGYAIQAEGSREAPRRIFFSGGQIIPEALETEKNQGCELSCRRCNLTP